MSVLLRTKLRPTFVAQRLLRRLRLNRPLTEAHHQRLVLILGEAGSGKSSLACDALREGDLPAGWYSLDPADQDLGVFVTHLVHAVASGFPSAARRSLDRVERAAVPEEGWMSVLTGLLDELVDYQDSVRVVLDDFHLVESCPEVCEAVQFVLLRAPANLQLWILSRRRPPLSIAFLRAKANLLEIEPADLRFNPGEVRDLYALWGLDLPEDMLSRLAERTEGWVTALQLLAQELRGLSAAKARSYLDRLALNDVHVYEYLANEVFDHLSPEIQNFLLATALPAQFNGALARRLGGTKNAEAMVANVRNAGLFLVELEDGWLRYHHLFREFLLLRLKNAPGTNLTRLHMQAGEVLLELGHAQEAVEHFLEGEDLDRAARVLEEKGAELLAAGCIHPLGRWLGRLPSRLRTSRPGLMVLEADVLDLQGRWNEAVGLYQKALNLYRQAGADEQVTETTEKLSLCYLKYCDTERLARTCEEGLRDCPSENEVLRSILSALLGATLVYSGQDWDRGYQLVEQSYQLAWQSGHPRAIWWGCLTYGFAFHFPQGSFPDSLEVLGGGGQYFAQKGWWVPAYQLRMNEALVMVMQCRFAEASDLIEDTLISARRAGHVYVACGLDIVKVTLRLYQRAPEAAAAILKSLPDQHIPAQFRAWHYCNRILLAVLQGAHGQAASIGDELMRLLGENGYGMYAMEALHVLAVAAYRRGAVEVALNHLEDCLRLSRQARARFWEMKSALVRAAILLRHPELGDWSDSLQSALRLTEAHGYQLYWVVDPLKLVGAPLVQASRYPEYRALVEDLAGQMGDRLLEQLAEILEDPSSELHLHAVHLLGNLSSERAAELLRRAQSLDRPEVRKAAVLVMRRQLGVEIRASIQTLGGLRMSLNEVPFVPALFNRPQVLKLYKYFLSGRDLVIADDQTIEEFWPEMMESSKRGLQKARHSLAQHISVLRGILEPLGCTIPKTPNGYRLVLHEGTEFDLREFERLEREGWAAMGAGDRERAVARFLRADQLYGGDFLAEDLYEDWIEHRRTALRQREIGLLHFLAEADRGDARLGDAILRYKRVLSLDPLEESAMRMLLECYEAVGDRATAERERARFRDLLLEHTGTEPQWQARGKGSKLTAV